MAVDCSFAGSFFNAAYMISAIRSAASRCLAALDFAFTFSSSHLLQARCQGDLRLGAA
jgi:hypothetical protein